MEKKSYFALLSEDGPKGCFRYALSNLLIELGDEKMAERVFEDFDRHPLVNRDNKGIFIGYSTRLISELTGDQYEGTLYSDPPDLRHSISKDRFDSELREDLGKDAKIIGEEREKGRIIWHRGELTYKPPAILIVENGPYIIYSIGNMNYYLIGSETPGDHSIVLRADDMLIDNGIVVKHPTDALDINSIITVKKTCTAFEKT